MKRVLLAASEVAVLLFGCLCSAVLGLQLFPEFPIATASVIAGGVLLTNAGLWRFRRRTRPWKIQRDAEGWEFSKAERKLHPVRAKCKRWIVRTLVWVPSAIAGFVLFFLPAATHLICRNSQNVGHYRVPLPWTSAVFPYGNEGSVQVIVAGSGVGRLGVTPFWDHSQRLSWMAFVSTPAVTPSTTSQSGVPVGGRELRLGDTTITCWPYLLPYRPMNPPYRDKPIWRIDCEIQSQGHRLNLAAAFQGQEEDIPEFYRIVEGVRPNR